MLICPIFATEKSLIVLYQERIRAAEIRVTERHEEINATLNATPDLLGSIISTINQKVLSLTLLPEFERDLNNYLNTLRQPEDQFTEEERRKLIAFPDAECLKSLRRVPGEIERFIKTYKTLADHTDALRRAANQTRSYLRDWDSFTRQLSEHITNNAVTKQDLLDVYKWLSFCHNQPGALTTSLGHLQEEVGSDITMIEETLNPLQIKSAILSDFFKVRAAILWEIILRTINIANLPDRYENVDSLYFKDKENPVKKFIDQSENVTFPVNVSKPIPIPRSGSFNFLRPVSALQKTPATPQRISSAPLSIVSPPSSSRSTPRKLSFTSLSSTPQLPTSLSLTPVSSPLAGQLIPIAPGALQVPQATFSAPCLASRDVRDDNFGKREALAIRLRDVFAPPEGWELQMLDFEDSFARIINAKYVVNLLTPLPTNYRNFQEFYLQTLPQAYNILTPKAFLVRPGLPLAKVSQTLARSACSFKGNGPLCLNQGGDEDTPYDHRSFIGNLTFSKGEPLCPSRVNEKLTQQWLEELCGIPADPVNFMAFENVYVHIPDKANIKLGNCYVTSDYINAPEGWKLTPTLNFITVTRKQIGETLTQLLLKIGAGTASFDQIDPSVGLRVLFSALTKQTLYPDNLELVKTGDKLALKRTGFEPILQPAFMEREDGKHQFLWQNICMLFPFLQDKIPEDIRKSFLSNDINLILSSLLIQFNKLQKEFDEIIKRYNLRSDSEIGEEEIGIGKKVTISKARALGIILAARRETIDELMHFFTIMKTQLSVPDVTYATVLKAVRPLEFACYEKIIENARKKIDTTPLFFETIFPLIMTHIRTACEQAIQFGETPLYGSDDLDTYAQSAKSYLLRIDDYRKQIEDVSADRENNKSRLENVEYEKRKLRDASQQKAAELALLREQAPELERIGKQSSSPSITRMKESEIPKRELELKEYNDKLPALLYAKDQKIQELRDAIGKNSTTIADLSKKLLPENLFKELREKIPPTAQGFLMKKYEWAEKRGCFYAHVIFKAWELMNDSEKPLTYEDLVSPSPPVDWSRIPLQLHFGSGMYAQFAELNHRIEDMAQDVINRADVSRESTDRAIETIDSLLELLPQPKSFHESWRGIFYTAQRHFLALPPRVHALFRSLGLSAQDEMHVLQRAQLDRCTDYEASLRRIFESHESQPLLPEQIPGHVYRQLWKGALPMDERVEQVVDAILDLLVLTPYSPREPSRDGRKDPGCLGLESNPSGRSGIFFLHRACGDHYLETWSAKWAVFFQTFDTLPPEVRRVFMSHSLPLLHLHWLQAINKLCPNTKFHHWFIPRLIEKSILLQHYLSNSLSITFDGIFRTLYPEIYFVYQLTFDTHKTLDKVIKFLQDHILVNVGKVPEAGDLRSDNLTPVERESARLSESPDGKTTVISILQKWNEIHEQSGDAEPMTLSDAAIEVLSRVNPPTWGTSALSLMLDLATRFDIDLTNITPSYWSNPKILQDLMGICAPLECIQLAATFRAGYPITITRKDNSYVISGTRGNLGLLWELIALFPDATDLQLPDNHLHSATEFLRALQDLPRLTALDLRNNPLQNPALLGQLTNLRGLNLSGTFVPPGPLDELRLLISSNTKLTPLSLLSADTYVNLPLACCEHVETILGPRTDGTGTDSLIKLLTSLVKKDDPRDHSLICYILSRLAERRWDYVITYGDVNLENIPHFFARLAKSLKLPCDPRPSAKRLLFMLENLLPMGTKQSSLLFMQNESNNGSSLRLFESPSDSKSTGTPVYQPCDLIRLEISKHPVIPPLFTVLTSFVNLQKLILTGNPQPPVLAELPPLPNLKLLDLTGKGIKSLEGLHTADTKTIKFEKLETLILVQNQITSGVPPYFNGIQFLLELDSLKVVDLRHNCLSAIPPLERLQYLDIRDNNIQNLQGRQNIENEQRRYFILPQKG